MLSKIKSPPTAHSRFQWFNYILTQKYLSSNNFVDNFIHKNYVKTTKRTKRK
jgi:hypothetical protein